MKITENTPAMLTANELMLGDVVDELFKGPFNTAVVRQIKDGKVTFFRPYAHQDDHTYTGGLTAYTGVEEFTVSTDSLALFKVVRRRYDIHGEPKAEVCECDSSNDETVDGCCWACKRPMPEKLHPSPHESFLT